MLHSSVVFLPLVFFSEDGIKVTGNFPDPFETVTISLSPLVS